ncbi:uncharacterized protein LOC113492834 isoform X5 [Trichoplusia ni]|uniref:Uncharacterized protein LOC113492834 isoform X5 n=1 Tax=Trichoplusia ni TaxID=7111 RepID=A0A7E5VDD6_TRINI|nr:uncharacterized protein LOC113492834 isoform X5 [Trichoplusia ni]
MSNTAEAKPPSDESGWQAIDIYLFANGQQYSPPRKYHLTNDELNWWDSTLSSLAKSLYGVMHPYIVLYTTDGHKVGGPLELIDGMAYVAVEPPDTFIDAGYDKYLIKATRSWEKRQARRGSPADGSEAPKHGCHHDQPCCLCPEKENVVTVESERSVLVTTEISTLRAPDETFVDSVREILVLLSLLPVVGCRWHATSYMNARCRHSTSDLAEVYRRFHTRTDEAWRYHFHETISSAARKRSADYIAAHNGPVNTVLGRTGQNGPWGGTYEPRTGKYIIEPAERGILDDYRTKLDESRPRSAVETSPDQCGRCRQDDKRRSPAEHGRLPEYGRTLAEERIMPVDYGRIPIDERLPPIDYRHTPAEHKRTSGERSRLPGVQGYTESEYGQVPEKQSRNFGDYGNKVVDDQRFTPEGYGRSSTEQFGTPGEIARNFVDEVRAPVEYGLESGYPSREQVRTSLDNGYATMAQNSTPGEHVPQPDYGQVRTFSESGYPPEDKCCAPCEHERTPTDHERTPSDNRHLPMEHDRGPNEYIRTSLEQERAPIEYKRSPAEHARTSVEFGSPSVEQRRTQSGNERLSAEQVRSLDERNAPIKQNSISGEYRRTSGQNHALGEYRHPPGQEPLTELDDEQEAYRDNNGGRRGELETKTGDLLTRLAANGARLSGGGGPSVAAGLPYVTESQQQNIRRSNMSSSLQNAPTADGKHRWSGATHSSMRRPSPNLVSPVPQRRSEDKKLVRTSREENRKTALKSPCRLSNGCAAPNVVGKQKSAPKYSCKRTAPQAFPTPATNFDQTVIKGKATSLTKIVSNHKGLTTDSTAVENIIGDKDIIVVSTNLFRNQESEIHSVKLDSSGKPVICHTKSSDETQTAIPNKPDSEVWIPVNEEVQTCSDPLGEEINMDRHEGSSRQEIRTSSKLKMSRPASGPRLNMVADDATPDENYIAIINKGDVVNLKVNIEVRSGESTNHNTSKKSHSLTNITRAEIGSQISIDEDMVVQSKSLQSLLNSEFRGTGFEGRPKVVVVQCACCGIRTLNPPRGDATPSENKKYFVLVPSSQHVNATVDKCDGGSSAKQTSDHPQSKRHGTSHPMNKTYSNTSIEAVTVRESPFPRREVGLFMATTNSSCQNSFGRNECPAPKPRVSITEDQGPRCNSVRRSTSQISVTQTGCVVSRNSNSNTNSRTRQNYSDATTQTEWCSVLVGFLNLNYSFHKIFDCLPSDFFMGTMDRLIFFVSF